MKKLLVPALLVALATSACAVKLGDSASSAAPADQAAALPSIDAGKEPVEAVVRRVLPAVVNVTTDIFQPDQFGGAQQGQGVGTGFIVRSDGVIVTNCHVVEGGSKITVSTSEAKPREFDARVIGGDCLHDLAVLKIDATNLPTVQLGNSSSLQLGQRVVALGYALALEGGPTVTTGIVSSLDRTIQAQDPGCSTDVCGPNQVRTYSDVIQTDAAINHGNSGGPLVDMQGRVIGINSAGDDSAQNIGFAIAIDSAKDTIARAQTDPLAATAYLGVSTQTVNTALAQQFNLGVDHGAYVLATTSDGPAQAAGIQEGVVIVNVAGTDITSAEDLGKVLEGLEPGQRVSVQIVTNGGSSRTVDVTLGSRPLPTVLP
jgi:S1-C subfamily serine protease